MEWLKELLTQHSVAQTLIIYGLIISAGLALGKMQVKGISLGTTWILFIGLLASYLGAAVDADTVHFLRDFGLVLFVYSIGLQVGPGFFSSLKQNALSTNLLAAGIVGMGLLITLLFIWFSGHPFNVMVGVMSGAVTNTPGLGAAQAAINDLKLSNVDGTVMTVAYALAYPFGVFGIIISFLLLQKIFDINITREQELHRRLNLLKSNKVVSFTLNLDNDRLAGQPLRTLFGICLLYTSPSPRD